MSVCLSVRLVECRNVAPALESATLYLVVEIGGSEREGSDQIEFDKTNKICLLNGFRGCLIELGWI